ncbi:MAG: DUF6908 domain-containing protein, partial [Microcystaceae cyanobacterium]
MTSCSLEECPDAPRKKFQNLILLASFFFSHLAVTPILNRCDLSQASLPAMNTPQPVSQQFISIVRIIALAYGMDLDVPLFRLRLEQKPYPALIIEKVGISLLCVAHYHCYKGIKCVNPQILFQIEKLGEREIWFPLSITRLGETCHVAPLDSLNSIQLKAKGVEESVSFWDIWADELVEQHWQIKGKPSPQVRAVGSRFNPLDSDCSPPSFDDDQPVLHLHGSYLIEGNKTGLLVLMEAAATAL